MSNTVATIRKDSPPPSEQPEATSANSSLQTIIVERRDRVGLITLNRPKSLNALNGQLAIETLAALKENGAVYLNGIGGAAQYYARTIEKVLGVNLMEFGIPEAMWHLKVNHFAAIVTMDAHGNSLHADVEQETGRKLAELQSV